MFEHFKAVLSKRKEAAILKLRDNLCLQQTRKLDVCVKQLKVQTIILKPQSY